MSLPAIVPILQSAFSAIGSWGSTIGAGLSVGSTVMNYQQGRIAAKAQDAMSEKLNDATRSGLVEDYDQITRMRQQAAEAAAERVQEAQIEGSRRRATVAVAAGEVGVGGLSVDALLKDLYGQEASIRSGVNQNLKNQNDQLNVEARGLAKQAGVQIGSRVKAERPSLFGAVLEGASGIYGAYKDDLRIRRETGGPSSSTTNYRS